MDVEPIFGRSGRAHTHPQQILELVSRLRPPVHLDLLCLVVNMHFILVGLGHVLRLIQFVILLVSLAIGALPIFLIRLTILIAMILPLILVIAAFDLLGNGGEAQGRL